MGHTQHNAVTDRSALEPSSLLLIVLRRDSRLRKIRKSMLGLSPASNTEKHWINITVITELTRHIKIILLPSFFLWQVSAGCSIRRQNPCWLVSILMIQWLLQWRLLLKLRVWMWSITSPRNVTNSQQRLQSYGGKKDGTCSTHERRFRKVENVNINEPTCGRRKSYRSRMRG